MSKGLLLRRGSGYVAVDDILWLPLPDRHLVSGMFSAVTNEDVTILIKLLLH